MNSVDFLDAVRERHGLPSDRKLGQFLDINGGRISLYRTGKRKLDPVACEKVANALGVDAGYVMAAVQAERAKRSTEREVWLRLAQLAKKSQAAALATVLLVSGFLASPVDAAALYPAETTARPMYIMVNQIRRWLRRLRRAICTAVPARSCQPTRSGRVTALNHQIPNPVTNIPAQAV